MRTSLGIDVGSSSVKVSLMDIGTGVCLASSTNPKTEMRIDALHSGWAEQDPDLWWYYICEGIKEISANYPMEDVSCIGVTYQMHGLVVVGSDLKPLRKSIIWCDSRAVEIGANATAAIGEEYCQEHLLNHIGNFTASKLEWVRQNEPEIFSKIYKAMLPGDFIVLKLSGEISTTDTGLSEGILWDFKENCRSKKVLEQYNIPSDMFCEGGIAIGVQARTSAAIAAELGIKEGTPISYRAGDQPNNAFSLNVMDAGEIAATGGTSGVVYGVIDAPKADSESRVNPFLHVNSTKDAPRYGVLLCINGTGIANAWARRNLFPDLSYEQMNTFAEEVPAGSDGVVVLPFGNGAERMLVNRYTKAGIFGLDLNIHSRSHVLRATQEGIAFAFRYGIDIMREMGLKPNIIRAGKANLFLSSLFRRTLATTCNARIELFNTDGSLGAARGAALGAGFYRTREEAFASLKQLEVVEPDMSIKANLDAGYEKWKNELHKQLNN